MHNAPINVGRGDPNWINTRARLAFNKLVEFGIEESAKKINEADGDMAGYVDKAGMHNGCMPTLMPVIKQIDLY